jgi:hypothetical protein
VSSVKRQPGRFKRVWGAPILLGVLGLAGLISALMGDGLMDALSYLSLAVPLVVIVWAVARRAR